LENRIARELQIKYEPVAVIFTNELPPDALQFKEGKWGCVIAMLTAAAKGFVDQLPVTDIPYTYVVFKPLSLADPDKEILQLVIFYVNADQLTALVVLANYDDPDSSSVYIPQASGRQSTCLIPFHESQQERPRAVVGLMDVSARPYVDPGILAPNKFIQPSAVFNDYFSQARSVFLIAQQRLSFLSCPGN